MNLATWLGLGLSAALTFTPSPDAVHAKAEHRQVSYWKMATGDLQTRNRSLHPWPVSVLSIGHTNASYQNYGSDPYFHMGLDIRSDAGNEVHASAGGKIINIDNYEPGDNAYWEIAILDDEGFIWQYHHIEHTSIPQEIQDAFQSGNPIPAGVKLGEVYRWPIVSMGERYNHIHLNILGKDKHYLCPFIFLEPLKDLDTPKVTQIGLLQNGNSVAGSHVSGSYSVYAEIDDLILSKVFTVPPHDIKISIDGQNPQTVWNFDSLPGGASETQYVENFYVPSLACGDYECKKPVMDLGFTVGGQPIFPLASGEHSVDIEASDFVGNSVWQSFSWTVD